MEKKEAVETNSLWTEKEPIGSFVQGDTGAPFNLLDM